MFIHCNFYNQLAGFFALLVTHSSGVVRLNEALLLLNEIRQSH